MNDPEFIDFQRNELSDFFIPYIVSHRDISLVTAYRLRSMYPTNRCVFLDPKANKCVVYPARPHICRMYPFDLVLTKSKKAAEIRTLDIARKICPGLGGYQKINLAELKETASKYMSGFSEHYRTLSKLVRKRGLKVDEKFLLPFENLDFMVDRKFSEASNAQFHKLHEDFYETGTRTLGEYQKDFVDLFVEEGVIKPNEFFMERLARGEITWRR